MDGMIQRTAGACVVNDERSGLSSTKICVMVKEQIHHRIQDN
jgi:hypothetical protein